MYRYFTAKRTKRYVDVLPDLVHSYNNTHHRSIGMAPMEVTADNEDVVRERLYFLKSKTLRWKFNVGDKVRISMQRRPFRKGYVGMVGKTFLFLQILPTVACLFFFRTDSTDSLDCLPILLSISVFTLVFLLCSLPILHCYCFML